MLFIHKIQIKDAIVIAVALVKGKKKYKKKIKFVSTCPKIIS